MNKRRRSLSLVALMAAVVVASALVWLNQSRAQSRVALYDTYGKRLEAIIENTYRNYYKEVDEEALWEGALRGAVAALKDPYSFYQSPEEQKREQENLFRAQFGGLGIRIYPEQEGERAVVKVSSVLPGTPALRQGLHAGDIIWAVEGESVILGGPEGLAMDDVVDMLRGPVGEPVTITIVRRGRTEPFDVTIERDVIDLKSVNWEPIEPGIYYVAIGSFTSKAYDEFRSAVAELQQHAVQTGTSLESIVLDLRGNRGGLLSSAKQVSDAFLTDGVIVSTRGRPDDRVRGDKYAEEHAADDAVLVAPQVEVVVLVNASSASGSEIVAGALKDLQRGILVGTKTFGKGVVQQRFQLEGGGTVSLTISSYYTPSGASIDGEGIEPDVVVEPDTLADDEAYVREKARKQGLIDDFVMEYIKAFESDHGAAPTDFAPLRDRMPELMARLKEAHLDLKPKTVTLEARYIFDLNVGKERVLDLEYDTQLLEALRIIKEVGVAKVLDGSYPSTAQAASQVN